MNKVTQAVIDLGGEWPSTVPHYHRLVMRGDNKYQAKVNWCVESYENLICTRSEFDKELIRIRQAYSIMQDNGISFKDWLKNQGRRENQRSEFITRCLELLPERELTGVEVSLIKQIAAEQWRQGCRFVEVGDE